MGPNSYIVKSRVLIRLALKDMQAFSDCLWKGNLIVIYVISFWEKVDFLIINMR